MADAKNKNDAQRPGGTETREHDGCWVSRRNFLAHAGFLVVATALVRAPIIRERGWLAAAEAATFDEVTDTFNGLLTFIVPGPDEYSVAQGVSTPEPGAIEANVTHVFIETIDDTAPYLPQFSAVASGILNDLATFVNPSPGGTFLSHFARLSFDEKVAVIKIMDSTDELKPLAGVLLAFGAFLVYSEAGVFDPTTRSLTDTPVGWTLSGYQGIADGRDEFRGYFGHRRKI